MGWNLKKLFFKSAVENIKIKQNDKRNNRTIPR